MVINALQIWHYSPLTHRLVFGTRVYSGSYIISQEPCGVARSQDYDG